MPVSRKVHACCTPKQEYVWIQGSTRLKLWLDTNDIGNCKESPFIFLRHVLFLYTLLNNWVNSFKQSLIKFKKILSHFGPYSNAGLFLFLSLKSRFPFFFFFLIFSFQGCCGKDSLPRVSTSKMEQRADSCQMWNISSGKLEAVFSSVFFSLISWGTFCNDSTFKTGR